MADDPATAVLQALRTIGKDDQLRRRLVEELKHVEARLAFPPNRSVRDEITGPIVDALFSDVGVLRKSLQSGLTFDFHYRSKIAREFVMSTPEVPDHVWEPQTTKLLLHLATLAQHAIVGGAYFGDQAIPVAAELARAGGTCHAFELNGEQAAMLEHNARLNRLENVVVNRRGLWSDDTTVLDLEGHDAVARSAVATGGEPNTTTIDRYVAQKGIERLGLIMLDIEGGEHEVLKGATRQLARPTGEAPNIVLEVHRSYVDWSCGLVETDVLKHLIDHGYVVFAVRDFQANYDMAGQPIELVTPETAYLEGPPHGFNVLAIKDRRLIERLPFKICENVSPKLLLHKSPALHHPTRGLTRSS